MSKLKPYLIAASVIACLLAVIGAYFYGRSDGRDIERKEALEAAMEQVEGVREEDKRKLKDQETKANEAKKEIDRLNAAIHSGESVRVGLRNRVASLESRINHAAATGDCETARATGILFADLFRKANRRSEELAEYADRARIAGHGCEQQYDALRGNP